jgi:pimeloyl-ACP methyl ester carboxylesterase
MQLFAEAIGAGSPTLILLHGAGVNGAVFKPLLRELAWPGRVIVPDLRGHGRSPHGKHYGLAQHAADVADLLEPNASVHVLGHSMGGAVGLILASGLFGVTVARASAFGVKVNWSADELTRNETFATSPVRWFDTRAAAAERFMRVAGLTDLVTEREAVVAAGVAVEGHRFRLAADPATVRAGGPSVAAIVAGARAPMRLFCGDRDPMVNIEELRALDPDAFAIEGCGHNPHVEAPEKVAAVVRTLHLN